LGFGYFKKIAIPHNCGRRTSQPNPKPSRNFGCLQNVSFSRDKQTAAMMKAAGIMPKWCESGDHGDGVKELQARLNRGYPAPKLKEDGIFGPQTEQLSASFSAAPV